MHLFLNKLNLYIKVIKVLNSYYWKTITIMDNQLISFVYILGTSVFITTYKYIKSCLHIIKHINKILFSFDLEIKKILRTLKFIFLPLQ